MLMSDIKWHSAQSRKFWSQHISTREERMPLTGLGDPARVIFSRSRYTNRRCNLPLPTCFYFDDKALNSFFFFSCGQDVLCDVICYFWWFIYLHRCSYGKQEVGQELHKTALLKLCYIKFEQIPAFPAIIRIWYVGSKMVFTEWN